MKASDYVAGFLETAGVTHAFELSGGMIAHLLDSIHRRGTPRLVSVHHEQAGAFAAEAVGCLTGRPAVALGTSGPGALNLVSGMAGCYYDSVPALFLVGQVQTYLKRRDRPIRQFGLQECDFPTVARPLAKAVFAVERASDLPTVLEEAWVESMSGRPGPVVIEIPFDVQGASLDARVTAPEPPPVARPDRAAVADLLSRLLESSRPLILAGGGVRAAGAREACRAFARTLRIPVATTIKALDVAGAEEALRVGMPGTYGTRAANLAVAESDVVLVLGSRLDQGVIGPDVKAWGRDKSVLHVDCDVGEMEARLRGTDRLVADVAAFLATANELCRDRVPPVWEAWHARVAELKESHPDTRELDGCDGINPNVFMRDLAAGSRQAAAFTVDAGQHTWWAAQSLRLGEGQRFLASTGLWSMGTAVPAAIGACLASGAPAVAICGDGGAQLHIQELQTIMRNALPVKIIVVNNHCHGMVRQFQEEFLDGRYASTLWGYSAPDFEEIARAFGMEALSLREPSEIGRAIDWLWERPSEPRLLQLFLSTFTNVYPHVPFGKPMTAMETFRKE